MRTKEIRPEKKQLTQDLEELLGAADALFLVSYKGLKVDDFTELRNGLAELQSECHVIPNRLFLRAAGNCGFDQLVEQGLNGDSALITGGSDAAAVAKEVKKFAGTHQALQVKLGTMNGQLLSPAEVDQLAQLPGREILLTQLLGVLQAPARNLAGVCYNRVASIVYALNAYYDKQNQ